MKLPQLFALVSLLALISLASLSAAPMTSITYPAAAGPGQAKHLVFLTGDEEYRSEETAPMLAKLLSSKHGFNTTVLFSINKESGDIDPNTPDNIPGIAAASSADYLVLLLRFRELPDDAMQHVVNHFKAGKPALAIRTSTHAFAYTTNRESKFAKWDWQSASWPGGFGQQIVGDTWVRHHGDHGSESTRGIINPDFASHPLLKGVSSIWGPTDVYGIDKLPPNTTILVRGEVVAGMKPEDPPTKGPKNDPLQPLIWLRDYQYEDGKPGRIIGSTIGAAVDFENQGLRRFFVNSAYWATGLESQITDSLNADPVGDFKPSPFGFNKFRKGTKVDDLRK
jgi:hypothetical protein